MEFYNVKLLPKGLPEIIAQFVPYDIYPETKIIASPRRGRSGTWGVADYNDRCDGYMGECYYVILYPTVITFYRRPIGTYSFSLWLDFLKVALHEIAHLATYYLWKDLPPFEAYYYVEDLAIRWSNQALTRILQVSPRLGQPLEALTGYPGIKAYRLRNSGRPWNNTEYNYYRQAEWRGLSCGGQVTINDIAEKFILERVKLGECQHPGEGWTREKARYCGAIHQAAEALGIYRYFTNKNGRRYLMFNAAEAEAVYKWLVNNRG